VKPFKIKEHDLLPIVNDELETGIDILESKRRFVDALSDKSNNPLSLNGLKFLSNDELLGRYIQIDNGATRTKWHICWLLRQRFDSDKLFGQYIEEFRDSTGTLCPSNRKDLYRSWRAGKFCETYGINSLEDFKLSKTVVYELSQAANEDVAGSVFDFIKNQDVSVSVQEVRRLLEQAQSIEGKGNIKAENKLFDLMKLGKTDEVDSETIVVDYRIDIHRRKELIQELCNESEHLTEEQILKEIITLIKSYKKVTSLNVLVSSVYKAFNAKERV